MRGEVIHFDNEHGFGFVTGRDGKRYAFERTDLRREFPVGKGTAVEFQPENDKARDLFLVHAGSVMEFGRLPEPVAVVSTGLWSYFLRGFTANYANFRERARRKEVWGFLLFWAMLPAALLSGLFIWAIQGSMSEPVEFTALAILGLYCLASVVPLTALWVRRLHDVGLSGWFFLLFLALALLTIGLFILLVFGLIPSQKHGNKWGPVPDGVTV